MSGVLNVSDAASLGIHAAVVLAGKTASRLSAAEIAADLGGSREHLVKVMRVLVKAGLVDSSRGPGGGFALAKPAEEISVLEVFEAIEGRYEIGKCLLPSRICEGGRCPLGESLMRANREIRDGMAENTLADIAGQTSPSENSEDSEDSENSNHTLKGGQP